MVDTQLLEFEARIAEGHKIEAHDWMPDRYRALLTKTIGFHALGEVAAFPIVQGLTLSAPTLKRKLIANAFIQDELGHGQSVLRVWQGLGEDLHTLLSRFESGELSLMNVLLKRFSGWSDFVVFAQARTRVRGAPVRSLGLLPSVCAYRRPYDRHLLRQHDGVYWHVLP
ncbi:Phenylacetic acid catabolic protein (plasmid) [Rhodococcus ruber]|uniref:Phenylacetic acid catabolic protein n=1 Tax=Rhodococcus ruber TaxID=1830 RepID=UPI0026598AAB|nr:Phenylacetic acid catabolic protein [Rhodococcus ruber]WKK14879.1 Phenylacetic acid catabolic protein [Rhodococcus ruber]